MATPRVTQDPPLLEPLQDPRDHKITLLWRAWVQQVNTALNRTGAVTLGGPRAVVAVTPGASPWVYQSPFAGDVRLLVSGGTVSALAFSRDGVTYYSLGITSGQITLSQNDFLRVTYTVVPTMIAVPA